MAGSLIESTLRVVTWNIWWRFGRWEERLPLIVEELRRVQPDVIALQEVWCTEGLCAADVIADELGGWSSLFGGTLEMEPGVCFGNAVISRWPIVGHAEVRLPPGDQPDEERLVVRAEIDGPRGPLQVFSTHLNWRLDHSGVRQAQVRALADLVAESPARTYPALVCGDFNAEPHSAEIEMLTGQREVARPGVLLVDAWRSVRPTDPGFTWDGVNTEAAAELEWNRRIDYVMVGWPKEGGAGHPVRCELVGTSPTSDLWPSDHFGVLADLRY